MPSYIYMRMHVRRCRLGRRTSLKATQVCRRTHKQHTQAALLVIKAKLLSRDAVVFCADAGRLAAAAGGAPMTTRTGTSCSSDRNAGSTMADRFLAN